MLIWPHWLWRYSWLPSLTYLCCMFQCWWWMPWGSNVVYLYMNVHRSYINIMIFQYPYLYCIGYMFTVCILYGLCIYTNAIHLFTLYIQLGALGWPVAQQLGTGRACQSEARHLRVNEAWSSRRSRGWPGHALTVVSEVRKNYPKLGGLHHRVCDSTLKPCGFVPSTLKPLYVIPFA